ncbi:ornithine cyclodeaminase family protein [Roseivivax sp. THAF30]|uniref:ornithine cyclodeaminase family protein n=1 Tax=Roseivivax sp. THAF30 TaxID=2587852 RepID=UPI0012683305|nr:ornithine cyclodeaminase [Roseivivax sp. THAF30]QFT61553.1 L-lysine cyclodeaminase [Roseivivax sp. THAF30]
MTTPAVIPFEDGEARLDWLGLCDAFEAGHRLPKAEIADKFLYRGDDTLLNRSAWIDGLGLAVKAATIFPGNGANGLPAINGAVNLFSDTTGELEAVVDFHLVTKWKTAGDSLHGARKLARPDSQKILLVGAGTVARSMVEAYGAVFPNAEFTVWNRSPEGAARMAEDIPGLNVAADLEAAVGEADIILTATMAKEPVIRGEWLRPGQHLDLIGAFRPDMREVDDAALQKARIFVDSFETTLDHIGELKIPLASGAIRREDVIADYYSPEAFTRSDDDITILKNGGGAHLDLMCARYIHQAWAG